MKVLRKAEKTARWTGAMMAATTAAMTAARTVDTTVQRMAGKRAQTTVEMKVLCSVDRLVVQKEWTSERWTGCQMARYLVENWAWHWEHD